MSIQLVTGFLVNAAESLDNRIVASGSTARNAIPYKYRGLRVFDTSNNRSYYWDGSSFQPEITDQVNGTTNYVPKFISQYYIGSSNIYVNNDYVGINTNDPKETFQIGSFPVGYTGQSLPLTFHKGGNTIIGYNWYYTTSEQAFDLTKPSTMIGIDATTGALSFKIRPAGGTFLSSQKQGLFISQLGRVGIGDNFSIFSPPTVPLDVTGDIKSSTRVVSPYILAEGSSSGDYFGIGIRNTNNSNSTSKTSALSFWGRSNNSPGNIDQRVADIYAQVRGIGGDQGNWTKSSLVMSVVPRNLTGGLINYGGFSGWNTHTIELREDGQVYMGPNQGAGSGLIPGFPFGAGASTISSTSPLFPLALPRLDILAGIGVGAYSHCIILRHNTGDTAATRRLGMIMKLSSESSAVESEKMGGVILESTSAYSNYPELSLVLGTPGATEPERKERRVIRFTDKDFFADIHRKTGGPDNAPGGTASYLHPSIASGEYTPTATTTGSGLGNCTITSIRPANWMRVGNVVSVSGQLTVDPTVAGIVAFELSLPVPANFYVVLSNSSTWRLNGTGVGVTTTYNIVSRINGSQNKARFTFYVSSAQLSPVLITYNYQYNQDISTSGSSEAVDLAATGAIF